mgnify:CR=1 FL=1
MNSPRRSVFITFIAAVLLLPASVTPGLAQTNAVSHSPAKVVEKYFALDNKGVRLDAGSFEAVAGLVDWKEEPAKSSSSTAFRCRMIFASGRL